jgi:hypothetical protein
MAILLASGCNEPYYPQMRAYLESVHHHNTVAKPYLVGVGWQPPSEFGFTGLHLPLPQAAGHGGTSWCVQHGGFLHVLPGQPDDIVVFTDGGDVVMQRDFSAEEIQVLSELKHRTVLVGMDIGLNLAQDAQRLRNERRKAYPLPPHIPHGSVFNTGVVACTVQTYWTLYQRYMERWPAVDFLFEHYARQQWLMSCILNDDPYFRVGILPFSFHTHGHAPMPYHCSVREGILYYGETAVLFKHRVAV